MSAFFRGHFNLNAVEKQAANDRKKTAAISHHFKAFSRNLALFVEADSTSEGCVANAVMA